MKTGFMGIKVFNKKIVFLVIIILTVIAACVKNTSTPVVTSGSSIAAIVKGSANLTLLDSAMSKAGLLATLDSTNPISITGPYTLFAPLNIAFANIGFTDSTIYKDSVGYLKRLVKYHIIAGYGYYYATLPQGIDYPVSSASLGDTLYLTVSQGAIYVNGNYVTQNDVTASNGVIQVLNGVLIPPAGNILTVLGNDTTLSYLSAAIVQASKGTYNLTTLLSSGVYTMFAPTNAAFRLTPDSTLGIIQTATPDTLARLLATHILNGRIFSSDFTSTDTLYSYSLYPYGSYQDSLFVSTTFGLTVLSKGDSTTPANIGPANILATNGLIHKVNRVLFPY
jgi:uncharacterized surface protein with fasciclin (FAS1) repeats